MATDSPNSPEKRVIQENSENTENQALHREQQERAGEFLDTQERKWVTDKERDAMADEVGRKVLAEQPAIPVEGTETNVDPKVKQMYLELEKDPRGTLDKWISGAKPAASETPGEALSNMTEALREHFKDISQE